MFEGFKKFIARGNMIDMAVGVVMGGAVTTVVNAIVNSVINPFIAMIFGKPNMDGLLAITFNGATVSFGAVLGAILNFLIIAAAVYFCILVPINKFRDMTELGSLQFCGAKGIRTPDPLHAMEMRYQLRHSPVELAGFEPATLCLQSRCATSCAIAP